MHFTLIILLCVALGFLLIPISFTARVCVALFSCDVRQLIRNRKLFHAAWLVLSILSLLAIFTLFAGAGPNRQMAYRAKTQNLITQVQGAILAYDAEYDVPPPGIDNATIIKSLMGDNPRGIAFLSLRPSDTNAKGEVLDAWGKPLNISLIDHGRIKIQTTGPNPKLDAFVDVVMPDEKPQ